MAAPNESDDIRQLIESLSLRLEKVERALVELKPQPAAPAPAPVPTLASAPAPALAVVAASAHHPAQPPPLPRFVHPVVVGNESQTEPIPAARVADVAQPAHIRVPRPALHVPNALPPSTQGGLYPSAHPHKQKSLEATIGLNWTGWIGAIVFVLGVLFFLKFAWDQGWIRPTPTMRVLAAATTGVVVAALGEWMHIKGVKVLAATLHGAGLAIALASGFASYALFAPDERVLGASAAFACVAITAAAGVGLALHTNTAITAIIALLGAYLAPFVLNTGEDHSLSLLLYVLALCAVGLTLTMLRPRWVPIRTLAWIGTWFTFIAWWDSAGRRNQHDALATLFLAIYFFGFLGEMVLTLRRAVTTHPRVALESSLAILSLLNSAVAFGMMRAIHRSSSDDQMLGTVAVALALIQALVFFATRSRSFSISCALQSAGLFTLSAPLLLNQSSVTLAWLALAVGVAALAWQLNLPAARGWVIVLILLCIIRLFAFDDRLRSSIVLTTTFLTVSLWTLLACNTALLIHVIAWMQPGQAGRIPWLEQRFSHVFPRRFTMQVSAGIYPGSSVLEYAVPRQSEYVVIDNLGVVMTIIGTALFMIAIGSGYQGSIVTLAWLLWAIAIIALSAPARRLGYIAHGLALTVVIAGRWFINDGFLPLVEYWDHPQAGNTLPPFTNLVAVNGLLLCAALTLAVVQLRRLRPRDANIAAAIAVGVALVLLCLLNFEACRTVDWLAIRDQRIQHPDTVKQVVMSVLWAIVGFVTIVVGFKRDIAALRYAALGLLGVTLAKILMIDMAEVQTVWRILSFVAVGALLLAVSFIYHKQTQRREQETTPVNLG